MQDERTDTGDDTPLKNEGTPPETRVTLSPLLQEVDNAVMVLLGQVSDIENGETGLIEDAKLQCQRLRDAFKAYQQSL
jgi:hypothetical protein